MNALELRKAIRARVCEVLQKHIFERAIAIAEEFGKVSHHVENSYSTTDYDFEMMVNKKTLQIHKSNGVYGLKFVRVHFDGQCMFSARQVDDIDHFLGSYDTERLINVSFETTIFVDVYIPTEWVDWLTPEKIREVLENEKLLYKRKEADRQLQSEKETLERERTRPLNDFEYKIASQFGIQLH